MSTNSDLQQINVFSKGMNTDTSDALLSNEQYRYAENLRFITDTGENSGELRLIEGYQEVYPQVFGGSVYRETIATTSIRNLIIFLVNSSFSRGNNGSEIIVLNTDTEDINIPYSSTDRWDGNIKYSLVTRWESGDNIKLYIADGQHELMSLNISMPDGSYSSINQLSNQNSSQLNPISWNISLQQGNIKCSVIQYCYYLYNDNGSHSDLSPTTEIIRLYDSDGKGYSQLEDTGKAVDLEIELNGQQYQNIILFRIEYVSNGGVPNVYVIQDCQLDDSHFEYTDLGEYGMSYSFAEFLSIRKYRFIPKLIESKNDYLFAANIQDIQKQTDAEFKNVTVSYELVYDKTYTINQYGKFVDGEEDYGPSLMVGETYRYGFVFYKDDGKYTSVMNITNVYVPKTQNVFGDIYKIQLQAGHRPEPDVDYEATNYDFYRIGVRFTINNIPQDCVGYDIVRCERTSNDSTTISQGLLGSTFEIKNSNVRYASAIMSLQNMDAGQDVQTARDLTIFASPESSYQMDDVMNVIKQYEQNINIREVYRYGMRSILHPTVENDVSFTKDAQSNDMAFPINIEYDQYSNITKINYQKSYLHARIDNDRSLAFNYLCPDSKLQPSISANIKGFNYVYSPDAHEFDNNGTITVENNSAIVNTLEYINWDLYPLVYEGQINITNPNILENLSFSDPASNRAYTISSGKKGILLNTSINPISSSYASMENENGTIFCDNIAPISIVNIERSGVNPYGGVGDQAYLQNTFYSFGNFKQKPQEDYDVVDIYDGDVYNCIFIYNSAHAWESSTYAALMFPTIYSVPIQSRVDLMARTGSLYPDFINSAHADWFQDLSGLYSGLMQDKDAYLYNTAHSLQNTAITYAYQSVQGADSSIRDTRIMYSQPKTDNELIDSWTDFKALNFIDVDTRYGEITNMRLFKNSLIYWQKNATGVLSVNERTMLQDVNDTNIILGNGEVLQRYDYLSLKYGMKRDQMCDTQSDITLYWWDDYNRDIIMYSGGQQVFPMKINKTVSNIINKNKIENPVLSYDNKYKEIMLSTININSDDKSLVYNELTQQFTSLYNVDFKYKAELNDKLFLINKDSIVEWNKSKALYPILKYIINDKNIYTKVYDNSVIGMGDQFFYSGNTITITNADKLKFKFDTIGQHSECEKNITSREYDLRFAIPRAYSAKYCDRMRGKTMQCELTSSSANFSIRYIVTKYRISYS